MVMSWVSNSCGMLQLTLTSAPSDWFDASCIGCIPWFHLLDKHACGMKNAFLIAENLHLYRGARVAGQLRSLLNQYLGRRIWVRIRRSADRDIGRYPSVKSFWAGFFFRLVNYGDVCQGIEDSSCSSDGKPKQSE